MRPRRSCSICDPNARASPPAGLGPFPPGARHAGGGGPGAAAPAIGLPVALAGTRGYVLQGLRAEGLPSPTLGYVYLPALVLVVATSTAAAPLGARAAHRLPAQQRRIIFALLLYVLAVRMLVSVW